MMVGRLLSYWDGPFSGAMLNFAGVHDNWTIGNDIHNHRAEWSDQISSLFNEGMVPKNAKLLAKRL